MKQYELETGTIGFFEVQPNWSNFQIVFSNILSYNINSKENRCQTLGKGNWQPLSLFSQLKEEDVKEVMPRSDRHPDMELYIDYTAESTRRAYLLKTAIESIQSLAQHLGFTTKNDFIKPDIQYYLSDSCFTMTDYEREMKQWQEAQSKVKQYFVVFKPKQ